MFFSPGSNRGVPRSRGGRRRRTSCRRSSTMRWPSSPPRSERGSWSCWRCWSTPETDEGGQFNAFLSDEELDPSRTFMQEQLQFTPNCPNLEGWLRNITFLLNLDCTRILPSLSLSLKQVVREIGLRIIVRALKPISRMTSCRQGLPPIESLSCNKCGDWLKNGP